jgi:hypothetical protein
MAVEAKNGGDKGRLDDQEFRIKVKIRNLFIIRSEHGLITRQTELLSVVHDVVCHVGTQS